MSADRYQVGIRVRRNGTTDLFWDSGETVSAVDYDALLSALREVHDELEDRDYGGSGEDWRLWIAKLMQITGPLVGEKP